MNRAQRKQVEKLNKELTQFVNKLSYRQQELMDLLVDNRVNENINKKTDILVQSYYKIFQQCMDTEFTMMDIKAEDRELLINKIDKTIVDHLVKIDNLEDEEMGKLEMDLREHIKAEIEKGTGRKEIIEDTLFKFKKASKNMVVGVYNVLKKEELTEEEKEIEAAAEYILENPKKKVKAEKIIENNIKAHEEIKEELEVAKKEEVRQSSLKIIKKYLEVEGQFGKYEVNETGVKKGEEKFSSLIELEEYKQKQIELFSMQMAELEEVLKMC